MEPPFSFSINGAKIEVVVRCDRCKERQQLVPRVPAATVAAPPQDDSDDCNEIYD
jgi:hypothetical protein